MRHAGLHLAPSPALLDLWGNRLVDRDPGLGPAVHKIWVEGKNETIR